MTHNQLAHALNLNKGCRKVPTRSVADQPEPAQRDLAAHMQQAVGNQVLSRLGQQSTGDPSLAHTTLQHLMQAPSRSRVAMQRQSNLEEAELLQGKFTTNLRPTHAQTTGVSSENCTGMPDPLKAGLEQISGLDLSGVRVHYNSAKPAQLGALAYAQGSDIHVAPGQEQHLPHEAWHVVQQAQGRVKPTMQMKDGVPVNDDEGLEHEADVMGAKAMQMRHSEKSTFEIPIHRTVLQCLFSDAVDLWTAGSAAVQPVPLALARVRSAIAQRIKINEKDITKDTPIETIKEALNWSSLFGIRADLSADELTALQNELTNRKDCAQILDDIQDKLEADQSGSEGWGNDESEGETKEKSAEFLTEEQQEKQRKEAADKFGWATFPKSTNGYLKLGVHETAAGNVKDLVKTGPSADKFGMGHGLGKGKGFYVTHVGEKTLYNAVKGIAYENNFVAIYIRKEVKKCQSYNDETNNVEHLDKTHGEENCYYVMSGGSEIVIPERCFKFVKVAANKSDIDNW